FAQTVSDSFLQSVFIKMFSEHFKEDFPKTDLIKLVTITGGGTPSREVEDYFKGKIAWLTSKDMKGDYIFDTEEHITEEAINNSATKLVPKGSILIVVKSKVLMHKLPIAVSEIPVCHGQDIKSIQCSEKVNPLFLVFVLKHNEKRLLHFARGANTEGLTLPMLESIPVPNVPLPLQEKFAAIAQKFERVRRQQREATRQAEHLFQTLLHRAFRGEL
ncbi:MAG: restriction endonuclease subunit S, partial [Acidobacteria bacterium]|nr:restriction endonuclease subunit S [Acidobacteriota bacterium]